jgi:activator of HSP90 ATPase
MKSVIQKSVLLPASPEALFDMYLDPAGHAALTGGPSVTIAASDSAPFKAFDGALSGSILKTIRPSLIIQSWRSVSFKDTDPDSTLIISFKSEGDDTRLNLVHLDVPDHDVDGVTGGWDSHYFTPWMAYLQNRTKS